MAVEAPKAHACQCLTRLDSGDGIVAKDRAGALVMEHQLVEELENASRLVVDQKMELTGLAAQGPGAIAEAGSAVPIR